MKLVFMLQQIVAKYFTRVFGIYIPILVKKTTCRSAKVLVVQI